MKKLLSLFLCLSLILITVGCSSEKNELKDYLEENSFTCNEGTSLSDFGYTCTKGSDNQEIFEITDDGQVTYTVKRGSYKYSISDSKYLKGSKSSETAIIMTDGDELTCTFLPDDGQFSYGGEFDTSSTNQICIDYIDRVNDSLRDFEKYYKDAGIELGE